MGAQTNQSLEALPWVVLKFGGTSVASAASWAQIAARVQQLRSEARVWIVASALSQVSNRLERAIVEAIQDQDMDSFVWIRDAHLRVGSELGLSEVEYEPVDGLLEELRRLLDGIRMTREASPRLRARVMSFGELASTFLGVAALNCHGLSATRVDARDLLRTDEDAEVLPADRYLSADVRPRRATGQAESLAGEAEIVITQGFIASNSRGETCLLGRGGSDTSGALFAALLGAKRLEIWTDVHGLFSSDPRRLPSARLIHRTSYREAQELAAMGAKVLHPRCLAPAAWADIPIEIRNTRDPGGPRTEILASAGDDPAVMAVVQRKGVTLLSIETLAMWGTSGFLAKVFAPFERLGISVDLVATSQAAVTLTLDHIPEGPEGDPFARLLEELRLLGEVRVLHPCAVVSVVGRKIRTVLHQLGPAFGVFRERSVHMVSESSEDLNISFVVDEEDADKLTVDLHSRLLPKQGGNSIFGPSWEVLTGSESSSVPSARCHAPVSWWRERRDELLTICEDGSARYVYHLETVAKQGRKLVDRVPSVDRFYYAMKANSHPEVLRTIASQGLGMECVSAAEIDHARTVLGSEVPILFTPNFCAPSEYLRAFELGAEVTVDGPEILRSERSVFAGRKIAIRLDPGGGLGHHEKVVTAGAHAKFGHPARDLDELLEAAGALGCQVVGLHAHVGSGILRSDAWTKTAELLSTLAKRVPSLQWIDVGGGLGVVERPGQTELNLDEVEAALSVFGTRLGEVQLRMEPGRYLVSEAGVLLNPVTQVRLKGEVRFVGVATGMNSLLRPALYGAWHGIHNLTRLDAAGTSYQHVVGPICETGDILGRDRLLPETKPGDVLLLENAGAYGRVMSSSYNLRTPADEVVLRGASSSDPSP